VLLRLFSCWSSSFSSWTSPWRSSVARRSSDFKRDLHTRHDAIGLLPVRPSAASW
jgi:hypothetical protein